MPYPGTKESKEEFIARFMASPEARTDYPDQKQRAAVAYSLWEKRKDNDVMATLKDAPTVDALAAKHGRTSADIEAELVIGVKVESEHTPDPKIARVIAAQQLWEDGTYYSARRFENSTGRPRAFKARHLEPGLVKYEELGEMDAKTGKRKDLVLLLRKEAIDKMRNSARGIPVVNWAHKDVSPDDFKKGKADGVVTGAVYNADDGWDWMEMLVWDPDTIKNCDRGFQVSCAYKPTDIDYTPGVYHNIPYDGEILNGVYEHIAVLPNPRYEKSMIICNSTGGKMKQFWLKLLGKNEPVEVAGAEVEMDGNKVPLEVLVNSYKAVKAEEEKVALENAAKALSDDAIVKVGDKEVTVKDLKAAHSAMLLKNAAAVEAQKKADAEAAADAEKKAKEAEALKNAADAQAAKDKADKEAEVLKNAKEAADRAEAEKKAAEAAEKAKADKEFADLKNAKDKGGTVVKTMGYTSQEERLALGRKMFGEEPAAK